MPIVFSTLTGGVDYCTYHANNSKHGGPLVVKSKISIKGGANLNTRTLVTPKGVPTTISDEEATMLEAHPLFKVHKDNGFVCIDKAKAKQKDILKNLKDRDQSAPCIPADFQKGGRAEYKASSLMQAV